jgi:hypothetical protein
MGGREGWAGGEDEAPGRRSLKLFVASGAILKSLHGALLPFGASSVIAVRERSEEAIQTELDSLVWMASSLRSLAMTAERLQPKSARYCKRPRSIAWTGRSSLRTSHGARNPISSRSLEILDLVTGQSASCGVVRDDGDRVVFDVNDIMRDRTQIWKA